MKNIITISILAIFLMACNSKETKVTDLQGRVKFETISIAPKIAGRIEKIFVTEGQFVTKGTLLAEIEVPEITAKIEQADGAITAAQGQLDLANNGATKEQILQIESQVIGAIEQLQFAKKSLARVENMYQEKLIPAQQYDEAKMKFEAANAQVNALKAKAKEIKIGARIENKTMAKGQVTRAIATKKEILIAEKERKIYAPSDMTIETISLKEGELALAGYSIFSGTQPDTSYFRFTIGENKINTYKVGSQVIIIVPNTNLKIDSKIVAIKQLAKYADNTSTNPNTTLGETTYELKVVANDRNITKKLYQNSTVLLQENR